MGISRKESDGVIFHSDDNGNYTGTSRPTLGGRYVATCVYGSYDCPQVWALRRFRDNTLKRTPFGRAFIRTYYAVSPSLVRRFGNCRWFQTVWRSILDRMVVALRKKGVKDTPYEDQFGK